MKNKIQTVLITLMWLALPMLVQAQYDYSDNGNGTCTITGYSGPGGDEAIPDTIDGLTVTSIGNGAFFYNDSITSLTIPNSVTSIGNNAFEYSVLGGNLTIPNGVMSIGESAFEATALRNVVIGSSVTNIGYAALYDCTSLTNITVNAFNTTYSSLSGVLFDKARATLIQYPAGLGGSYTIPNTVTSIGHDAFFDCNGLTSVIIPNNVRSIGYYAFSKSQNLTSVTIGSGVTNIEYYAFYYCTSLQSVTIPNSVTSIEIYTFSECASLTDVNIGTGVHSIGSSAFYDCYNLESVTIPKSVTSIGSYAFGYNYSLMTAYFQGNAPPDDGSAFSNSPATVYYLSGTTGWVSTFGSRPAMLWNPQANEFTFSDGNFSFNLTGPPYATFVVEACTNLASPKWLEVDYDTFSDGGTAAFHEFNAGNYPSRFYRVRSP